MNKLQEQKLKRLLKPIVESILKEVGGKLLATSPTEQGIVNQISKYFYGSNISLKPTNYPNEFEVHNSKGKINQFKVVVVKGKYRFEHV